MIELAIEDSRKDLETLKKQVKKLKEACSQFYVYELDGLTKEQVSCFLSIMEDADLIDMDVACLDSGFAYLESRCKG